MYIRIRKQRPYFDMSSELDWQCTSCNYGYHVMISVYLQLTTNGLMGFLFLR